MSKFCNVCGTSLNDSDQVCPRCGNRNFSNLTIRQSKNNETSANTNTRNNYDSVKTNYSTNSNNTFVSATVNATNSYTPVNTDVSSNSSNYEQSSSESTGFNKKLLIGFAAVVVVVLVMAFSGSSAPTEKDLQQYIAQNNVNKIVEFIDYCHKHKDDKKLIALKKEAWEALVMMNTNDSQKVVQDSLEKDLDKNIIISALVKKDPEYVYKQITEAINKADGCGKNIDRAFQIMSHCDSLYGSYNKELLTKAYVGYKLSKITELPLDKKLKAVSVNLTGLSNSNEISKAITEYKYYYNLFDGGRYLEKKQAEIDKKIQQHINAKNTYKEEILKIEKYGNGSVAIVAKTRGFDAALRQIEHLSEQGAKYMAKYFQEDDIIAELEDQKRHVGSFAIEDGKRMNSLMYRIAGYGKNMLQEFKTNTGHSSNNIIASQENTYQNVQQETTPNNNTVKTGTITGNDVNVRKGPGTNYESLGVFFKGDIVRISGNASDNTGKLWYQIEYDNPSAGLIKGYVVSDYLRPNQ